MAETAFDKLTAIADTIRGYTGWDTLMDLDTMKMGVDVVHNLAAANDVYFEEIADAVNSNGYEYITEETPYREYDDCIRERLNSEFNDGITTGSLVGVDMYKNDNVYPYLKDLRERMRGSADAGSEDFPDLEVNSHVAAVISDFDKLDEALKAQGIETPITDTSSYGEIITELCSNQSGGDNPIYYAMKFNGLFSNATFPENYDFVLKVKKAPADMSNMFLTATGLKTVKFISEDNTNNINYQACFRENKTLETVDLTEYNRKPTSVAYLFLGAHALKSVYGALDFTNCTSTTIWLNSAYLLEDIEFVPNTINITISFQWCTKLTKASITSAINGLNADVTGQTVTFNKYAVNNAFGINVDDESTYTDEFNALRQSKSNWTFAYAIA